MNSDVKDNGGLALLGGKKAVRAEQKDIFAWPIFTAEHEKALLKVLRSGNISGIDVTKEFEEKYACLLGRKYALTAPNGTASILEAMYGLGVGVGDEVIAPSITFWASIVQAYNLGATPVFADIDPETLCIDPADIEKRITERTKAIVAVHYSGMPADMNAIINIAKKHNLKILEDCSHAHGGLYKGRKIGTFGDASVFSLMSGKSFPVGEGGIFFTDDREVYERAILFGHYIRHNEIELESYKPFVGLPCGGFKNRLNQLCSALGLVELDAYPAKMAEIDRAMNYFCDGLEGLASVKIIRPEKNSGTTKGGWYYPVFGYAGDELDGLSLERFARAVRAEGSVCSPGFTKPLHLHPLFTEMDVYGHGRATRTANIDENVDTKHYFEALPVSENINSHTFVVPWFKKYYPEIIDEHVEAYRKVVENYRLLLADDNEQGGGRTTIGYTSFFREQDSD